MNTMFKTALAVLLSLSLVLCTCVVSFAGFFPSTTTVNTMTTTALSDEGIDTVSGKPANGNHGPWYFYGVKDSALIKYSDNAITMQKTSSSKIRKHMMRYSPEIALTTDTIYYDFEYVPNVNEGEYKDKQLQYITLSSAAPNVGTELFYAEFAADSTDILKEAGVYVSSDSICLAVSNGELRYADEITSTFKKVPGVEIENEVKYYVKAIVDVNSATYDLYFDDEKIGINSSPVLTNQTLSGIPSGSAPAILNVDLWSTPVYVDGTAQADTRYIQSATISNYKISQSGAVIGSTEGFEVGPQEEATGIGTLDSTILSSNWKYRINRGTSPSKQRLMTILGTVTDPTDSNNLMYRLGDLSGGAFDGVSYVYFSNPGMFDVENLDFSLEFISKPNGDANFAQAVMLTSDSSSSTSPAALGYEELLTSSWQYASLRPDSAALYMIKDGTKDGFYIGDETSKTLVKLPTVETDELAGVTYIPNTKYYLNIKLDTVLGVYDMYLSTSPITEATKPVATGVSTYYKSSTPKKPVAFVVGQTECAAGTPSISYSDILIDNFKVGAQAQEGGDSPVDYSFKAYNDDMRAIVNLPSSGYVDVYGEANGTGVLVEYAQEGVSQVKVVNAADGILAGRITPDHETVVKLGIFNLENLNSIIPQRASIELTK